MGLFRLGDWPAAIAVHERVEALLGDRVDDPPRPYLRAAAVRAFMHEARGERAAADRQLDLLRSIEDVQQTRSAVGPGWVALTLARRGQLAEAREWLDRLRWREGRGQRLETLCDLVAEEEAWNQAPATVREAREHAEWAGLLALPCYADRLEGRAALGTGDPSAALEPLRRAVRGFTALEARWEAACSELFLGEALFALGRADEAETPLRSAAAVFQELSSVRELEHARRALVR
jgi:hypothetical protein